MVLQFLIHLLLYFSCCHLINYTAASKAPPMARESCHPSCGKISIPFPFGIGEGCYFDEWFEVVCNTSVPFLKRINLELTGIDLHENRFEVKVPITFWDCNGKEKQENSPNLQGSSFAFDDYTNKFTAVACESAAKISELNGSVFVGCSSVCSDQTNDTDDVAGNMACNIGVDCCQTSIPSNIQAFNTSLIKTPYNNRGRSSSRYYSPYEERCRFTFLVNETWFSQMISTVNNISAFYEETKDVVPVVIKWGLSAAKFDALGKSRTSLAPDGNYSKVYDPIKNNNSDVCYTNSGTFSSLGNQSLFVCRCVSPGFEGNPYLSNGCQDIDECAVKGPKLCSEDSGNCLNTFGGYLCGPKRRMPRDNVVFIGICSGFGAVALLLGTWGLYKFVKRRRKIQRKKKFFKRNGGLLLQQQLSSGEVNVENTKLFNSKELEKATDRFNIDRVLGQGGQGTVYKGMLADGKIVAIKKSKIDNEGRLAEFINEVVILSQINHRNVVKLLGCCLETEVPLLVYEYVPNGTLSQYIYEEQGEFPLTWEIRLRIATEIAGALSYLHSSASLPIYHRDIKSTNILLDGKYRAKIADFGMSRSFAIDQTHLTTQVHGTFGYLDPEYFQSSQFTDKSDVYSFGVVLVELLTGQKPISIQRSEQGRSLATYFMLSMREDRLFDIVDARVMKEGKTEAITAFAELAKRCLNLNGKKRPTMREVVAVLEDIQALERASGAAHEEQHFEEVECVREVPYNQPCDSFTTSKWSNSLCDPTCSLSDEIPLFSHISH